MQVAVRMKDVRVFGVMGKVVPEQLASQGICRAVICAAWQALQSYKTGRSPALGRAQDLAHHPIVPACEAP